MAAALATSAREHPRFPFPGDLSPRTATPADRWSPPPQQPSPDVPPPHPEFECGAPVTYIVTTAVPGEDCRFIGEDIGGGAIYVRTVEVDGAFHKAGIGTGRVISVDSTPIQSLEGLAQVFTRMTRTGRTCFEVVLAPALVQIPPTRLRQTYWIEPDEPGEDLGFEVRISESVHVMEVVPGKAFHRAGVVPGTVVSINQRLVRTTEEFVSALEETQQAMLRRWQLVLIPDAPARLPRAPTPPVNDVAFFTEPLPQSSGLSNSTSRLTTSRLPDAMVDTLRGISDLERRSQSPRGRLQPPSDSATHPPTSTAVSTAPRVGPSSTTPSQSNSHSLTVRPAAPSQPPRQPRSPSVAAPPLFGWAMTNKTRVIFLRESPDAKAAWAHEGSVFGIVKVLHCVGEWCCVRTPAGRTGYLRSAHITYLPHGPTPQQEQQYNAATTAANATGIINATAAATAPPSPMAAGKALYDPVAGRWFQLVPSEAPTR